MKLRYSALLLLGLGLSLGCANVGDKVSAVVFPAHPDSWDTKGESTAVEFEFKTEDVGPFPTLRRSDETFRQQAGGEIAAAARFVIDAAVEFLREEAKRYEASYAAVGVHDLFYTGWTEVATINLEGIQFTRRTYDADPAIEFEMDVIPTRDHTAFQLKPKRLKLTHSKAKLHLFNWLEPWTWIGFGDADRDLDLTVKTVLHAAWRDAKGDGHFKKMAEGEFKLRNVEFGVEYTADPADPATRIPAGTHEGQLITAIPRSFLGKRMVPVEVLYTKSDFDEENVDTSAVGPAGATPESTQSWLDAAATADADALWALGSPACRVPCDDAFLGARRQFVSYLESPVLGTGNFVVSILITEIDDYGAKVKEGSDALEKNRDGLVEQFTGLFD